MTLKIKKFCSQFSRLVSELILAFQVVDPIWNSKMSTRFMQNNKLQISQFRSISITPITEICLAFGHHPTPLHRYHRCQTAPHHLIANLCLLQSPHCPHPHSSLQHHFLHRSSLPYHYCSTSSYPWATRRCRCGRHRCDTNSVAFDRYNVYKAC
ncbi:hypothetical protein EJ08DRAFT_717423 [Tothia fuscella]|uniref:Uncharacterized protein n=1 Tax=Tothia fuscella TaxID=1048955 RepID=A0A9P4TY18_9PEZI|nr:hypothetical protein EJ08DRAFT_717423 [Tothia fuscella]